MMQQNNCAAHPQNPRLNKYGKNQKHFVQKELLIELRIKYHQDLTQNAHRAQNEKKTVTK